MEGYPKLERPNGIESRKENTLSVDEVECVFESLLGENEFKEIRKLEDEQGLYLWDIKVLGEDEGAEYSYIRAGHYSEGQSSVTAIHVTFLDERGVPAGGHSVAKYTDGKWQLTP